MLRVTPVYCSPNLKRMFSSRLYQSVKGQ